MLPPSSLTSSLNSMPHGADIAKNLNPSIMKLQRNFTIQDRSLELLSLMPLSTRKLLENMRSEDIPPSSSSSMEKRWTTMDLEIKKECWPGF